MYISNKDLNKIITMNKNNELVCIFVKFLLCTGARLVEALDSVPRNISSNNCCIRIANKRKRTRTHDYYREIYVPNDLIEDLSKYIKKNDIKNDEKIFKFTSKTAINYIHIACITAGFYEKITPKTFRNSFAQNQIEKGIDDFELSYLLGNVDIKKTILCRKLVNGKHIA